MRLLTRREALWLGVLLLGLAVCTGGVLLIEQPQYVIELEGPVDESEVAEHLTEQYRWGNVNGQNSYYDGSYNYTELSPRGREVLRDLFASDRRSERKVVIAGGLSNRPELPPDFTYPYVHPESGGPPDRYVIRYEGTYYELRTFERTGRWHGTVGFAVAVTGVFISIFAVGSWYRERGPPLLSTPARRR